MRAMLDACVLFPTVMREVLIGCATAGLFQPRWSARILEEWARAAIKLGPDQEQYARGEVAMLRAHWPESLVTPNPGLEARLWLPDPLDVHVLAVAIADSCDVIVTMNAKDFPRNILAEEGLLRADPDGFCCDLMQQEPDQVARVVLNVVAEAERLSGDQWTPRKLMRKARLPRLGKAVERFEPHDTLGA